MNRKQIAVALSAAVLSLSAVAANAAGLVNIGDENNLNWLPVAKSKAPASVEHTEFRGTASTQFVHIGDENNLDWLPTPAKR